LASESIRLIVTFRPKPEQSASLRRAVQGLVAPTRREQGCIEYRLHEVIDRPDELVLYEAWAAQADLDRHLETPALRAFVASLDQMLAEPLSIRRLRDLGE
jgi:quinol monooxygenase YgiN